MRFSIGIAALASSLALSTSVRALDAGHCAVDLSKPFAVAAADAPAPDKKPSAPAFAEPKIPDVVAPAPLHEPKAVVAEPKAKSPTPPAQALAAVAVQAEALPVLKDVDSLPALKHVAGTGATLLDLGEKHGLHSVAARVGDQFMILQVAPDGQAVVGGPVLELSEARLMAIGGEQVTSIGENHGLKGLFLRNGAEFQVLYATPDRQAMIAGVMWDSTGKNITRDQVSQIEGTVPTVVVSDGDKELAAKAAESGLAVVKQAAFGAYGREGAPELWMIVDPACTYSIRAFDQLKPFVQAGRLQLRIVPISILDHEDNGMSTKVALALLSNPMERMASLWMQRNFGGQPSAEAAAKLQKNGQIAEAIKLTGTPTFLFRKPDGSEGRLDGMPTDIKALLAEVSGRS